MQPAMGTADEFLQRSVLRSLGQQPVLNSGDSFPRARLAWQALPSFPGCGSLLLLLLQCHWPENELPSIGQGQVRLAVA